MDIVRAYGNVIRRTIDPHPAVTRRLIDAGLFYEANRARYFSDRRMPKAYVKLNTLAVGMIRQAMTHPKTTAWTNLFTPVELLQCFDLNCLSAEAVSSFLSGFTIEDHFINRAEAAGIAPTLCSYHKCFLGSIETGLLPLPKCAVTTSTVCDANFNTFRLMEKRTGCRTFFLDIPSEYSADTLRYVKKQLKDLIRGLTETTGKAFDIDRLREILQRENESKACYRAYLTKKADHAYPSTLTLQMYGLFATHLSIGTEETLDFFRMLQEEIEDRPVFHGKRIYWLYVFPFYHEVLKQAFNFSDRYQLQGMDMNIDYMEELSLSDPLSALAEKLIRNLYNLPAEERRQRILQEAKALKADGVIHFCHWGCKQSVGGAMLMKDALAKEGLPMLILDGDGTDRRNDAPGQIKTRLEAFLEVLG